MSRDGQMLRDRLAGLAGRDSVDLAETAWLLARLERPGELEACLAQLDALAAEAGRETGGCLARAGHLAAVLAGRRGFAAMDGDEPDHANFLDLLEAREGSAETLAILWLEVARRAGWTAEALAFPACPLVRLGGPDGGRIIVNPALGGLPLEPHDLRAALKAVQGLTAELEPGHFEPLDDRAVLVRLLNEEKLRRLRRGRIPEALGLVEAALLFAPATTELWREAGMMHLRLDRTDPAIAALEQYVARAGNCPQKRRTQMLL